jgi:hypothetical protein
MNQYIDQFDVVDMLHERTHFFKKDLRKVLEELENIIYENMQTATVEQPSECRLFFGFILGAKRIPERQKTFFNQPNVTVEEHLLPYVKFKTTFKNKMNNYNEVHKDGMDETAE